MAWIDARAVKLGCIGFSKTKSYRSSRYGSPLAKDVCKKANPKAYLIEIFNDKQSRFLMTEKVRKQVRTHIGIDTYGKYWWIGAKLTHGTWYWEHSKKRATYWSRIGANYYGTSYSYPHAYVYLSRSLSSWYRDTGGGYQRSICQISVV